MEKTNTPDCGSHLGTELLIHDDSVMEGFADSHEAVKGHHSQQQGLSAAQEVEEMKLDYASPERNGSVGREEILQHLRQCHRRVTDIQA